MRGDEGWGDDCLLRALQPFPLRLDVTPHWPTSPCPALPAHAPPCRSKAGLIFRAFARPSLPSTTWASAPTCRRQEGAAAAARVAYAAAAACSCCSCSAPAAGCAPRPARLPACLTSSAGLPLASRSPCPPLPSLIHRLTMPGARGLPPLRHGAADEEGEWAQGRAAGRRRQGTK